ncbi:TPA: hypothetical protein ACTZF9_004685 [Raoultella planticola]
MVALPGPLLLTGIPDKVAIAMRHAFCQKILASHWKQELLSRHASTPLRLYASTPLRLYASTPLRLYAASGVFLAQYAIALQSPFSA